MNTHETMYDRRIPGIHKLNVAEKLTTHQFSDYYKNSIPNGSEFVITSIVGPDGTRKTQSSNKKDKITLYCKELDVTKTVLRSSMSGHRSIWHLSVKEHATCS